MTGTDALVDLLKTLRLSGVLQSLEIRIQEAIDGHLTYDAFLGRVLRDEVDRREGKKLDIRIRRARFEGDCHLEDFDFRFNEQIPREKVLSLGTCSFVDRAENILLVGPTGTGKSHLAQALGQRACRMEHDVAFYAANDLFTALRASRGDGTWEKRMRKLVDADVLIIDDMGLRPLKGDEPYDFHELVRRRHGRRPTICTSNRDIDEWGSLFPDALLAAATMDRLLQDAHVIRMVGDSYRNPPPSKRRSPNAIPATQV